MNSSERMNRALIDFKQKTLDTIHNYSLELLRSTGIKFPSQKALGIFEKHGLRTDGDMVFFEEADIHKTMATVPSAFTIKARNPAKSIRVGDDHFVMAPGYGPPFIIEPSGEKRDANLKDVQNFCKLVQTSKHLDFNSSMVVQPGDVPQDTAHLDILLSTLLLTDKPIMGSSVSEAAARDSLKLAATVQIPPKYFFTPRLGRERHLFYQGLSFEQYTARDLYSATCMFQ